MITLHTNPQPAAEADKLHDLVGVIYSIMREDTKWVSEGRLPVHLAR